MTIGSEGQVLKPTTISLPDGGGPVIPPTQGKQGEYLVSELHGKYGTASMRQGVFMFNRTAITIPQIAATLASVYSLWNPTSSGTMAELIDTEIGVVSATTVVNVTGWYASSGSVASAATFTTKAVAFGGTSPTYFSARTGEIPNGQIQPFTALTHSGTPDRVDIIATVSATSGFTMSVVSKVYDGRLWLLPGSIISVANSTAAGQTTGTDVSVRWAEYPFING